MRSAVRALAALTTAIALAACSGNGAATSGPAATSGTASICTEPADAATVVATTVADNAWAQPVSAKVGDVITWSNDDSVPHRVVLDDGSCSMSGNIGGGASKSLVFSKAGAFPFHCGVHSSMKGTITIS